MKTTSIAAVVAGINAALGIDLTTKRVASAFCEDFVDVLLWMITPNELAQRAYWRLFAARLFDDTCDGASLRAVQPAIWAEAKTVDDRVRIFDAKSFE